MKPIDQQVVINREGDIVQSVQIDTSYSEDKGQYTSVFHYKLDKALGVGANNTEALAVVSIEHKNPINYEHFHHTVIREDLARKGDCDVSMIVPITKEQYESEKNTESGEN